MHSYEADGFVQTVKYDPSDNQIFYTGTTHKVIVMFDRRAASTSSSGATMLNTSMVNSLYIYADGNKILSGDASGMLRWWDVRTHKCFHEINNDEGRKPISHVHVSHPRRGLEDRTSEGRYLSVNSYDNVLRVYDRQGSSLVAPRSKTAAGESRKESAVSGETSSLLCSMKGHKNKNWPIRSSFFHGLKHRDPASASAHARARTAASSDEDDGPDGDDDDDEPSQVTDTKRREQSAHESLLLATGSADGHIYVFDVGGAQASPLPSSPQVRSELSS